MSGYRSLENKEIAFIQAAIEEIYTDFINLVAEGREMTPEKVDEIAQGRIWSGLDAIKIGLADERGGLKEALNSAATASGVETYRIVEYPVKKTQLDKLMEMISDGAYAAKAVSNPEMLIDNAYMYLRNESGIKHFARLPFNLTFEN
ncbi:MAG: hypothetical protein A2X16_10180 [Bacteroidetes bacterium GWF2_39_10]|nr:MAG: hypothetical protein A2X16_10180 [Bacteroidetes bacterium GWF2_39_10]